MNKTIIALLVLAAACNTQPTAPGDTVLNVAPDAPDNIVVEAPVVNEGDVNVIVDGSDSDSGTLCQFEVEYYLGGTHVLPTRPLISIHHTTAPYGAFDGEVYTVAIEAPAGCGDLKISGLTSLITTVNGDDWFDTMRGHSAWVDITVGNDDYQTYFGDEEGPGVIVGDFFMNYLSGSFVIPDGGVAILTLSLDTEFDQNVGPDLGQMFHAEVGPLVGFSYGENFNEVFIMDISSEGPLFGNWLWRE